MFPSPVVVREKKLCKKNALGKQKNRKRVGGGGRMQSSCTPEKKDRWGGKKKTDGKCMQMKFGSLRKYANKMF